MIARTAPPVPAAHAHGAGVLAGVPIAGLELGGTKCLALLADGPALTQVEVATTTPDETLARLEAVLTGWWRERPFGALGIASFGPLGLRADQPGHGCITTTPKPGWANTPLLARAAAWFPGIPIGFDTDVTGAALAEAMWGDARGLDASVYLTIGTGIGGGAIVNGRPVRGLLHPEMGHVCIRRAPGDAFPGICLRHGDCIEGLASGPAIAARAGGRAAETIADDDPVWADVAHDLGAFLATLILALSPQRIALGGSVIVRRPHLLGPVRAATIDALAGYVAPVSAATIDALVAPACFGTDAGPLGAIALGVDALAGGTAA